jgi:hypothetical protein
MEKLNEGKPFLKDEKLSVRMAELAAMVRQEHGGVQTGWQGALEHVRNAGEWLIEAKWRKGHRKKWGDWKRWLAKEYNISTRTMSQYMQIARHWDDARITKARTQGITIESISAFVQVLRGRKPKPKKTLTPSERERDNNRKEARRLFAAYLRELDGFEGDVLCATFPDVLEVLNADLRPRVCGNYGGPYYEHREEATTNRDEPMPSAGPPVTGSPRRRRRRPSPR